jgi:hypothetical protein
MATVWPDDTHLSLGADNVSLFMLLQDLVEFGHPH